MASLQLTGRKYKVRFRWEGKRYSVPAGSLESEAVRKKHEIEAFKRDLKAGRLTMPDSVNVPLYIGSCGRVVEKVQDTAEGESATFGTLAAEWVNSRWKTQADATAKNEERHVRFLTAHFGMMDVRRITLHHVQAYVTDRLGQGTSAETVLRRELVSFRGVMKLATRRYGDAVPAIKYGDLEAPRQKKDRRFQPVSEATDGRQVLLTKTDVAEIVRLCDANVRDASTASVALAVRLVAATGIRRSEMLRLTPKDVDFETRLLTVTELKFHHGSITYRKVDLSDDAVNVLKSLIEICPPGRNLFPWSSHRYSVLLREALTGSKYDIRGLGWHSLRHSFVSRLLNAGVASVAVMEMAGHATLQTTSIYAHALAEVKRAAVRHL